MALVLTVIEGNLIKIGEDILITFKRRKGNQMRIVLQLPKHIQVRRIKNVEEFIKESKTKTTAKRP